MSRAVRIITIHEQEEAMIRVESARPITLEFSNCLVTVYEMGGVIFQRVEPIEERLNVPLRADTPESFIETQPMDVEELETQTQLETPSPLRRELGSPPPSAPLRASLSLPPFVDDGSSVKLNFQGEYDMEAGDTQLDA